MKESKTIIRFLTKSILFLAIFLGCSFVIDQFHKKVIMNDSLLNRKEGQLSIQLPNIKTLVIGDSHLAAGFNTAIFGHQSFNYTGSGENYLQNYYKLKSVLDQPNSIKTIVVPYELHSSSSFRNNRITDYSYYGKQIPFLKEAINQRDTDLCRDFLKSHLFSYLEQMQHWKNWWKGRKQKRIIKDGVEVRTQNFATQNNQQEIANRFAAIQFKGATVPHTVALRHLHKITELCKEKNKQIILIRMPVTPHYLKEVAKFQDLQQLVTTVEVYRITYFSDIPFFNFRDSLPSLDLFSDANHLNFEGSKIFTKQLVSDLEAKGIEL